MTTQTTTARRITSTSSERARLIDEVHRLTGQLHDLARTEATHPDSGDYAHPLLAQRLTRRTADVVARVLELDGRHTVLGHELVTADGCPVGILVKIEWVGRVCDSRCEASEYVLASAERACC
ncbi:MAG: hypothetical protein ACOX61_09355 [Brooklawnia sp.]